MCNYRVLRHPIRGTFQMPGLQTYKLFQQSPTLLLHKVENVGSSIQQDITARFQGFVRSQNFVKNNLIDIFRQYLDKHLLIHSCSLFIVCCFLTKACYYLLLFSASKSPDDPSFESAARGAISTVTERFAKAPTLPQIIWVFAPAMPQLCLKFNLLASVHKTEALHCLDKLSV